MHRSGSSISARDVRGKLRAKLSTSEEAFSRKYEPLPSRCGKPKHPRRGQLPHQVEKPKRHGEAENAHSFKMN